MFSIRSRNYAVKLFILRNNVAQESQLLGELHMALIRPLVQDIRAALTAEGEENSFDGAKLPALEGVCFFTSSPLKVVLP